VGDNREKWGYFWEKLIVINQNIVSRSLWSYPASIFKNFTFIILIVDPRGYQVCISPWDADTI
jgi:hypothetical protein